jgi:hypothetical protein
VLLGARLHYAPLLIKNQGITGHFFALSFRQGIIAPTIFHAMRCRRLSFVLWITVKNRLFWLLPVVSIISRYNEFLLSHMPRYGSAQIIALQAVFVAFARYVFCQGFPLPFCLMRLPLFNQLQAYLSES